MNTYSGNASSDFVRYQDKEGANHVAPIVMNFDAQGQPVFAKSQIPSDPSDCDHAGHCYSCNMDVRCPDCGARLFLPGRILANLSRATLELMHFLWRAAGWPEYSGGRWAMRWPIQAHPLFEKVGGIPVDPDRLVLWLCLYGVEGSDGS